MWDYLMEQLFSNKDILIINRQSHSYIDILSLIFINVFCRVSFYYITIFLTLIVRYSFFFDLLKKKYTRKVWCERENEQGTCHELDEYECVLFSWAEKKEPFFYSRLLIAEKFFQSFSQGDDVNVIQESVCLVHIAREWLICLYEKDIYICMYI